MNAPGLQLFNPLRILHIGEEFKNWPVKTLLTQAAPGQFHYCHAMSVPAALDHIGQTPIDIVLIDKPVLDRQKSTIISIRNLAPHVPVIAILPPEQEAQGIIMLREGMQDYLLAGQGDGYLIKRTIRYAIERKLAETTTSRFVNKDMLTGLANRSLFENRLEYALARCRRSGELVSVITASVYHFPQLGISYGQHAVEQLLQEIANKLSAAFRAYDTIARLQDGQFAIIAEGIDYPEYALLMAQKMMQAMQSASEYLPGCPLLHIKAGSAVADPKYDAVSCGIVLAQAEEAMHSAMQVPGSAYRCYEPIKHKPFMLPTLGFFSRLRMRAV